MKKFAILAVAGMLASIVGTAMPATAETGAGSVTGAAVIEVTCNLPAWPTAAGVTTCNGIAVGGIGGIDNKGTPGEYAAVCAPCTVSTVGTIAYSEDCSTGEPATGFAQGTLRISGATASAHKLNAGLGGPVASVDVPFHWQRAGVVAVITAGKLTNKGQNKNVSFSDDSNAAHDEIGGAAVGVLIPNSVPAPCGSPAPLTVTVVAADVEIL